jgi:hypothetical protein
MTLSLYGYLMLIGRCGVGGAGTSPFRTILMSTGLVARHSSFCFGIEIISFGCGPAAVTREETQSCSSSDLPWRSGTCGWCTKFSLLCLFLNSTRLLLIYFRYPSGLHLVVCYHTTRRGPWLVVVFPYAGLYRCTHLLSYLRSRVVVHFCVISHNVLMSIW